MPDTSAQKPQILLVLDDLLENGTEISLSDARDRLTALGFNGTEVARVIVDQVTEGWYKLEYGYHNDGEKRLWRPRLIRTQAKATDEPGKPRYRY